MIESLERGLWVIERVRQAGSISTKTLGALPGWDKVKAHRYLKTLEKCGWLENVSDGQPRYVLGQKVLDLAPDFRM
ncbi:MAG: helix-turn-helix domain-containing protein [Myxococcales bacterium]|nr:helix-turn-helix domain-containing protein [Myxococcales bacterium]